MKKRVILMAIFAMTFAGMGVAYAGEEDQA